MRQAAVVAFGILFAATTADAGEPPASGPAVEGQLTRSFGTTRTQIALPLRALASEGPAVDLVVRMRGSDDATLPGLRAPTESAVQLDVQQALGTWTGFGHAGWRHSGQLARIAPSRTGWYAELGTFRPLAQLEFGGHVDVRQDVGDPQLQRDGTLYAAFNAGAWRWQLSLVRSLPTADVSGDKAVELSLRARF